MGCSWVGEEENSGEREKEWLLHLISLPFLLLLPFSDRRVEEEAGHDGGGI